MKRQADQQSVGRAYKRKRTGQEELVFCTIKSKLCSVVKDTAIRDGINSVVITAHDTFKRALFFLKAFCLEVEEVPEISVATMKQCINQV